MVLKNKDILQYLKQIDDHLKTSERIQFVYDTKWASQHFEDKPAVYCFYDKKKLVYIGETASLLERMRDIRRTYNHTFRKHRGMALFQTKPNKKGVFSIEQEHELNAYFENNIEITFHYITFGRTETESYLIHKNKGENSDLLYNKIGRRDLKVIKLLESEKK